MTLRDGLKAEISNNTIQNLVELAMPVMVAALKANSTEFDGITGGYNDLVPSDVKTAKAYKEGYRLCEESDVLKAYLYCCMKSKSPEEYVKMLSGNSSFLSMDAILKEELKKSVKDEDLDIKEENKDTKKRKTRKKNRRNNKKI